MSLRVALDAILLDVLHHTQRSLDGGRRADQWARLAVFGRRHERHTCPANQESPANAQACSPAPNLQQSQGLPGATARPHPPDPNASKDGNVVGPSTWTWALGLFGLPGPACCFWKLGRTCCQPARPACLRALVISNFVGSWREQWEAIRREHDRVEDQGRRAMPLFHYDSNEASSPESTVGDH